MARSRSSFDVTGAIATATSLTAEEAKAHPGQSAASLISFGTSSPPPAEPPTPTPPPVGSAFDSPEIALSDAKSTPARLPDLSAIVSPVARCERIVEWITEATGATDVFLADAAGLPLAGAVQDADSRLAGAGLVASSIASLALSLPGNHTPLFELHLGEGPFFQIIGFQVGAGLFIVGLTRQTPLSPRQAHAIRLACRHALGDTLRGGS
jgi:hypothetical protein